MGSWLKIWVRRRHRSAPFNQRPFHKGIQRLACLGLPSSATTVSNASGFTHIFVTGIDFQRALGSPSSASMSSEIPNSPTSTHVFHPLCIQEHVAHCHLNFVG